jgi:toxin ParE1/3/4
LTLPTSYAVRLTLGAERDLQAINGNVTEHRSPRQADALLDALLHVIDALEGFSERGGIPRELADLGVQDYRQLLLPPYRIIYRVIDDTVYIMLIADGRRDMQSLLEQRLLR